MNTAKKSSGGGPLDPPSNTALLDPITHINTETITPATKYAILRASSLQSVMQNIESLVMPPRTNPPPCYFSCFFKKCVAVENKYSVFGLHGNKFSGRAHDENK